MEVADNGGWEDRSDIFEDSDGEAKATKRMSKQRMNINEMLSGPQVFFFFRLFDLATPPQTRAVRRRIQGFQTLAAARVECRTVSRKGTSNKAVLCSGDKVLREISGNRKEASKSTQRSNVINVVFKGNTDDTIGRKQSQSISTTTTRNQSKHRSCGGHGPRDCKYPTS